LTEGTSFLSAGSTSAGSANDNDNNNAGIMLETSTSTLSVGFSSLDAGHHTVWQLASLLAICSDPLSTPGESSHMPGIVPTSEH
jgi:hypothetical protein